MKMVRGKIKTTGCILLSFVFAFGAVPAVSQAIPKASAAQEQEMKAGDDLKLWYDESAVADFYEIYAKKFKWLNSGQGDGFLEFGRSDPQNYIDGQNHANDSSFTEQGTVTQAVKDGVSWAKYALPVGNGHMGAMSFGYTDTERVQMNEDTLWTGGPNCTTLAANNNADVYGNVNISDPATLMENLVDNAFTGFYESMENGSMPTDEDVSPYKNGLTPNSKEQEGAYQSFCEMFMDFNQDESKTTDYRRELDLNTAISSVTYDYDGVTYSREMFASYPDDVIVYKVSASEEGKVGFNLHPEIPHMGIFEGRYNSTAGDGAANYGKQGSVVAEGDTISLTGTLNHNGMKFAGQFKVVTVGGTMSADNTENNAEAVPVKDDGNITVSGADEAYIIVSLTTDHINDFDKNYTSGETLTDLTAKLETKVENAASLGYDKLLQNHEADYTELFDRVKLDIGAEVPADVTTDRLLEKYKQAYNGSINGIETDFDKYLETLYYQYGRYLLIASSRDNSLPANLQGVWNDTDAPAWSADYHTNINIQMNYWLAEETNLAETATSLVDFANDLRKPGRLSLAKLYGIGYNSDESQIDLDTEDGFIFFCNTTPLGFTGNIRSNASFTQTATAFLGQNLYDYYAFTKDIEYLKSDIYPFLREACITYLQTLHPGRTQADADKLYIAPSWSSEQTASTWTVGTYFDQQLVWQLFNDTIQAQKELGIVPSENMADEGEETYITSDEKLMARLQDALGRLDPVEIGDSGQIKEWQQEGAYNKTQKGAQIGEAAHRHISQLIALYPGNYITKENQELMDAAKVVLTNRSDYSTGWGLAARLNLWARTGDGNHSYKLVNALLGSATYPNLFDTHAPFQIDGNFGGTAGITEMLLQSNAGKVELLPALPDAWNEGSYEGLVARGNFEVSVEWSNKTADYAEITSKAGEALVLDKDYIAVEKIKDSNGNDVTYSSNEDGDYVIETTEGVTYQFYTTDNVPTPTPSDQPTATPGPTDKPEYNLGDVDANGSIELADAQLALKAALNIISLDETQKRAADIDKNGVIELSDAQNILKAALKIITLE